MGSPPQDVSTDTCDMAVSTEPECLGPCEPGTHVNLEGIVWHESDNGKLVLFNKTFVKVAQGFTKTVYFQFAVYLIMQLIFCYTAYIYTYFILFYASFLSRLDTKWT